MNEPDEGKDLGGPAAAGHKLPELEGELVGGPGFTANTEPPLPSPEPEPPPSKPPPHPGPSAADRMPDGRPLPPDEGPEPRSHAHDITPDGRPYIVKVPGGSIWFVATETGFAAVDTSLVRADLLRHWPNLNTKKVSPTGVVLDMEASDLWEKYGARADHLFYSYLGQTRYIYGSEHGGELHVRVILADPPPAVYHADVMEWLRLSFSADDLEKVLDWLATMPELDKPTCVMVLLGKTRIGKSMLAHGSARYFGCAVADYDDIFKGRFNGGLLRTPIVHCDETAEVETHSGSFRKMVANSRHAVEEKNRPTATLLGCPRIIVTSNEKDPLKLGREDLSQDSEEAIGRRILMVKCSLAGARHLEAKGGRAHTGDWIDRPDGKPGKIPELIAWLVKNRKVKRGGSFLVEGDAAAWAASIGTRTGLPATILDAIATFIASPAGSSLRRDLEKSCPFLFDDNYKNAVIVSNQRLRAHWQRLIGEPRVPSHNAVSQGLARLAPRGRERLTLAKLGEDGKSQRPWAYVVPLSLLEDRMEEGSDD
jgi:hypothetical protein